MTSWGNTGMQTDDYDARHSAYDFDVYSDNGMVLSTPSASAKKRRGAAYVQPLTIPVSPNFATSRRGKYESELISTEQMRLMQLKEQQEQFKREREKAQIRKQQALYGAPLAPARSEKQLTEPKEFSFATTTRFGAPRAPPGSHMIAPTPPSQKKQKLSETRSLGITVPEPFHFATDTRPRKVRQSAMELESGDEFETDSVTSSGRKAAGYRPPVSSSPWVPLKQRLREIEQATPEHWKKTSEARPRSPVRPLVLTKPVEPVLHTAIRSHTRPDVASVPEDKQTHAFKAHPLNRKILESSGDLGVMRVVKRPLTQPMSPKLRVASLASRRPTPAEIREREEREAAQKRIFKAMPVNGALPPESPKTSRVLAPKPLTVAESPKLHTKQRSVVHTLAPKQTPSKMSSSTTSSFKIRTAAPGATPKRSSQHTSSHHPKDGPILEPFVPRQLTIPQPFALATDERSAVDQQRRMEQLEKEKRQEAERRQFKARAVPMAEPFRPYLELKITEPQPFALRSEVLHDVSVQQQKQKLAEEEEERRARMEFKARPLPQAKPMEIKRSQKPLTEISDFVLNSDSRSLEREAFERQKQAKEKAAMDLETRRQALEAERQKQDIKRLRQTLVHKAVPVPQSLSRAPAPIKASCQPLTEPKTPNFHTSHRRVRPTAN